MTQEAMIIALSAIGPVIGSGIGVLKKPSTIYIHNMLYFAAGIMLAISFLNLIPESRHLGTTLTCVAGLVIGAAAMWTLDHLFPHVHECAACGEDKCHMGHTANFLILDMRLLCAGYPAEAFHTLTEVAHEYHLDLDKLLNRIDKLLQDNKTSQKLLTQQKTGVTNNNCDILK